MQAGIKRDDSCPCRKTMEWQLFVWRRKGMTNVYVEMGEMTSVCVERGWDDKCVCVCRRGGMTNVCVGRGIG